MDYSSLFSSGLRAISSHGRPSSMINVSPTTLKPPSPSRPPSRSRGHERTTSSPFPLSARKLFTSRQNVPSRDDTPSRSRVSSLFSPTADLADVWTLKDASTSSIAATSYLSFDDESDSDLDDMDISSLSTLIHIDPFEASSPSSSILSLPDSSHHFHNEKENVQESFLSFTSPSPVESPVHVFPPRSSPISIQTNPMPSRRSSASIDPISPLPAGDEEECWIPGTPPAGPLPLLMDPKGTVASDVDGQKDDWRQIIDDLLGDDLPTLSINPDNWQCK